MLPFEFPAHTAGELPLFAELQRVESVKRNGVAGDIADKRARNDCSRIRIVRIRIQQRGRHVRGRSSLANVAFAREPEAGNQRMLDLTG